MPPPAPSRRRRITLAAAISLATTFGAGAGVVRIRTEASWQAMQHNAATLDSAWYARDHRREPLYGKSTSGSAFAGYAQALEQAQELMANQDERVATLPHGDDAKVAGTEALRARWQPALIALRAAAHCNDAAPAELPAGEPARGLANLLQARWLVNMAVLEARARRLAGQPQTAVEHTLDAATFGADLVRSSLLIQAMIGSAMVSIACHEAWPDHALQQLDAPALAALGLGLERLEALLPERLDLAGELRCLSRSLQAPDATCWPRFTASSWRYGFSARWMAADAFTSYATFGARLDSAPQLPWPQREAWLELELGALSDAGNPLAATLAPNLGSAERTLRTTLAQVRLLRMAVALHRGQECVPLADPLGDGPFAVVHEAGAVVLRSAGEIGGKGIERRVAR
jgi:hypothetical protein